MKRWLGQDLICNGTELCYNRVRSSCMFENVSERTGSAYKLLWFVYNMRDLQC